MIEAARIYTMSEVAAELQHSTRWFRRERRRLEREGFPPPVSRIGHPRWLGADLLAWLGRDKPAEQRAQHPDKVIDYERVLADRARTLARTRADESG